MLNRQGHWIAASGVVLLMAALGVVLTGDPGAGAYARLVKPPATPTLNQWMAVGAIYYCGALVVVGRLLRRRDCSVARRALLATGGVLLLNEFWNVFLFRLGDVELAHATLFPFLVMVLWTAALSWRADRPSGASLLAYGVWLLFDLWWAHQLTRLN